MMERKWKLLFSVWGLGFRHLGVDVSGLHAGRYLLEAKSARTVQGSELFRWNMT